VRKNVQVRREEILAAAVEQVRQRGLIDTRVIDVARALGVSKALVHYHFDSKEKLLAAAFTYAAQRDLDAMAQAAASGGTALERLWEVLDVYAPTGDASGWVLWIDGWAAALRDEHLRTVVRELDHRWKQSIAALIRDGVQAGEFGCDDPDGATSRITALLDGLAVQQVVRGGVPARMSRAWVESEVARELGLDDRQAGGPGLTPGD
jgi:AcrR family transcriptional regulator